MCNHENQGRIFNLPAAVEKIGDLDVHTFQNEIFVPEFNCFKTTVVQKHGFRL